MNQTKFQPDTMEHIKDSDLVQLSRELLDAVIVRTSIMEKDTMTPEKLKEAKLVLGFLNTANRAMTTKMQYFRMTGVGAKAEAIRKSVSR